MDKTAMAIARQHFFINIAALVLASALGGCAAPEEKAETVYSVFVSGPEDEAPRESRFTTAQLEDFGVEEIPSRYFDRGLGYKNSRLRTISLTKLVERFNPEDSLDALLLDCFDDYQGLISVRDVREHDLRLATGIELEAESSRPGWLNPLMIIVPDGGSAPNQERYMTANVRSIRFVRLNDYYAPLRDVADAASEAGFQTFKDNCLFCHSLKGVGGNKGAHLLEEYNFSRSSEREFFRRDFFAFHNKDNPDKQDLEQFVDDARIKEIAAFLKAVQDEK